MAKQKTTKRYHVYIWSSEHQEWDLYRERDDLESATKLAKHIADTTGNTSRVVEIQEKTVARFISKSDQKEESV